MWDFIDRKTSDLYQWLRNKDKKELLIDGCLVIILGWVAWLVFTLCTTLWLFTSLWLGKEPSWRFLVLNIVYLVRAAIPALIAYLTVILVEDSHPW